MKTQWPPDAEVVYEAFKPLTPLLWPALDFGCDQALQYFERIGDTGRPNPWLFSHLARFQGIRWLNTNGLLDTAFAIVPQPFSGIWLRSNELDVRVLKIDHRPDPVTKEPRQRIQAQNISEARKAYYYQPRMEFDIDMFQKEGITPPRVRLLVLWDVEPNAHQLAILDWACPKWLSETKRLVETHWWLPVPKMGERAAEATFGDTVSEVLLEDLDLPTSEEDETGGEDESAAGQG